MNPPKAGPICTLNNAYVNESDPASIYSLMLLTNHEDYLVFGFSRISLSGKKKNHFNSRSKKGVV